MMDKKIKNKIIAISGEPVSGKGTTVRELKNKLIEGGLKEENIHIISTGIKFREYFNKIIDFMKNRNNNEKERKNEVMIIQEVQKIINIKVLKKH